MEQDLLHFYGCRFSLCRSAFVEVEKPVAGSVTQNGKPSIFGLRVSSEVKLSLLTTTVRLLVRIGSSSRKREGMGGIPLSSF